MSNSNFKSMREICKLLDVQIRIHIPTDLWGEIPIRFLKLNLVSFGL